MPSENDLQHESVLLEEKVLTHPGDVVDEATALGLHRRSGVLLVLTWLARLRWLAIAGQSTAVAIAALWLEFNLPLRWLFAVIAFTGVTNLLLVGLLRRSSELPEFLVPLLLLTDVLALTALLAAAGGPSNPFCQLYLIHVAMAVVVLRARWTWAIVIVSVLCFGLLFFAHVPLARPLGVPPLALRVGDWLAFAITAGVIAYFVGRLRANLRERERQLEIMRDRIEQNERLASLATLAAGAAHELATPLGTIALVARELERPLEKSAANARTLEDVKLIRSQVDRCRDIVDRMNIERTRQNDEFALDTPVDVLLANLADELKPGQFERVDVHRDAAVATLRIHRAAVVQALGILLQNAIDASDDQDGRVKLSIACEESNVRFAVADQGCGMTPEQLSRAGEPFATTKSPSQGMGLGLFLARSITEHLNGSLRLSSAPGQGTVAVLQLPAPCNENRPGV
jgi:two-component system sensor histidine kinase RegB